VNSIRVTADQAAMEALPAYDGLSVVRATAAQHPDGRWSVVAYGEDDVVSRLVDDGFEVEVLRDSDAMATHWDDVQADVDEEHA
jgi:hypothetical protein